MGSRGTLSASSWLSLCPNLETELVLIEVGEEQAMRNTRSLHDAEYMLGYC